MGRSFKGTKSAGGVGQRATQTSITSVAIGVATAPRHPPSAPATKALCGSPKAGPGRPVLLEPPQDRCAWPSGSRASCNHWERAEVYLWGFPAASCFSRGAWGNQLASKGKQKTLKHHYFLKHYDDLLTLQVTVTTGRGERGGPELSSHG